MYLGKHITVDLFDVNMEKLTNLNKNDTNMDVWDSYIKKVLCDAHITLINTSWHNFDNNGAFTALYLLAESHLSIHTWPEHSYIAVDVFTCGDSNTQLVVDQIVRYFEPQRVQMNRLNRGEITSKNTFDNSNSNSNSNSKNTYDTESLLY
jgi:S-adenosylmethionine decarboxylase proenzyme